MATINGKSFYASKQTQWGGEGSDPFSRDYQNAVNYTLAEYATVMNLVAISTIKNADADITVDNVADEHVISKGVDMWLSRFGNFQSRNVDPQRAEPDFKKALDVAMTRRDQATAAAADTTDDVIGLL